MKIKRIIATLLIVLLAPPKLVLATSKYYNRQLCSNTKEYTCIKAKRRDTWDRLFPDPRKQNIIKKINRMNVELEPGMIIALPNNLENQDPLAFAPFPIRITPFDRNVIIVDLDDKAFAAYDTFGALVHWGPISAGQDYCPDIGKSCRTPTGTFYIQSKQGANCKSSIFPLPTGGAPMPYCMFFNGGIALHGGPREVPGYNASHGCVRLFTEDAEWLNKNFIELGEKSTEVIVQQ